MQAQLSALELIDTDRTDLRFQEALSRLFDGDGTIYLVSGYFTYQGYLTIRDDIISFLERTRENRLVIVVGIASDQFSARIASDLWSLDEHGQVDLYKQSSGLHAKLYYRDGPDPRCIIGSANITQVAFEYNTELNVEFSRDSPDHPDMVATRQWAEGLIDRSKPLRRRDVLAPVLITGSVINWTNKARILPARNVVIRSIPLIVLLVMIAMIVRVF